MTYQYFIQADGVPMIQITVDSTNSVVRPVVPGDELLYPPPAVEEKPKGKK